MVQEPPVGERPGGDLEDRRLGEHTTVLFGAGGGRYPDANALLVEGSERTLLADAPLGVRGRLAQLSVDLVVLTHCHEDHIAALDQLGDAECWVHAEDRLGLESLEGFLDIFGYPEPMASHWRQAVTERFHYAPRADARAYEHEHRWHLGGVSVTARHAPGHTRGHCVLHVEPDDVLFLADLDLSSFGPYYGDAWSDLEQFERTLAEAEEYRARTYVTGHHLGELDATAYRARLARYRRRIAEREQALLAYLEQPRTLDEIVAHRFVYRPGDQVANADQVERRSMSQHLDRLLVSGVVARRPDGAWVASA